MHGVPVVVVASLSVVGAVGIVVGAVNTESVVTGIEEQAEREKGAWYYII